MTCLGASLGGASRGSPSGTFLAQRVSLFLLWGAGGGWGGVGWFNIDPTMSVVHITIWYMSLFIIPVAVAGRVDCMMRNFLYEMEGEEKRDHLISWDQVSLPRNKGGSGIGNVVSKNISQLVRLIKTLEKD